MLHEIRHLFKWTRLFFSTNLKDHKVISIKKLITIHRKSYTKSNIKSNIYPNFLENDQNPTFLCSSIIKRQNLRRIAHKVTETPSFSSRITEVQMWKQIPLIHTSSHPHRVGKAWMILLWGLEEMNWEDSSGYCQELGTAIK